MNRYLNRIDNPRKQNKKPRSRKTYEFHGSSISTFIEEKADLKIVPVAYRRQCLQRQKEDVRLLTNGR